MLAFTLSAGLTAPRTATRAVTHTGPLRPRRMHAPVARTRSLFAGAPLSTRPSRPAANAAGSPTMRFSGGGRGTGGVPMSERALSALAYLLPILDSLSFGRFVFAAAPTVANILLAPLLPLYQIYRGVPFVAFGVFLALYIFVVRNQNVARFVRFNVYQALLIDIALIFPQLLAGMRLGAAVPPQVVELACSSVFYAVALAVGYAVAANVRGRVPDQIPGVSNAVYSQMGPM